MAKKSPTPAARRPKKPEFLQPLVLEERMKLKALLNDPIMQKALSNAAAFKPGVHFVGVGTIIPAGTTPEMSMHISNNRLHEIRGWEQYETALFAQTLDPKPKRSETPEDFPDAGMIDQ